MLNFYRYVWSNASLTERVLFALANALIFLTLAAVLLFLLFDPAVRAIAITAALIAGVLISGFYVLHKYEDYKDRHWNEQ